MSPVGFEPTISAGERPQTYALDRAATGTGKTPEIRKKRQDIVDVAVLEINGISVNYMKGAGRV